MIVPGETAESAGSIIDYTIRMHPKLREIIAACPLTTFARETLRRMLELRIFSNADPDPNHPRHATPHEMEMCMAMIECFITGYAIGVSGK